MQNRGGLGPETMWLIVGILAMMFFGWKAFGPKTEKPTEPTAQLNVGTGSDPRYEAIVRRQCLALPDRVWVGDGDDVECIAYAASPDAKGASVAIAYLGGDVGDSDRGGRQQEEERSKYAARAARWAGRLGVPVIIVGRPGLMGSSGFHLLGGRRGEARIVNAALDAIQQHLGFRRTALAGQSGGARIIAQLMILGRRDIACAAMGSGAYGLPRTVGGGRVRTNIFGDPGRSLLVPMQHAADIPAVSDRRSFVIGDPRDRIALFEEQKAWADTLVALGHHAQLIEAAAGDPDHHGMSDRALIAAALCAKGGSDAAVRAAVTGQPARQP